MSSSAEPVIFVSIGGVSRNILIDSGSASNLVNLSTVQELKHQGLKIQLQPCKKQLYAYGGRELEVEGQFQIEVSITEKKIVADFIVVKAVRRSWNSLCGPSRTVNTENCNTVDDSFLGQLKENYPTVLKGIGKLCYKELKFVYIVFVFHKQATPRLTVRAN